MIPTTDAGVGRVIDRGSGPPVVLLPGIQGRWEWMAPAVHHLAERCRVITFSLCDEPSSGFRHDPARGIGNYLAQIEEALDHVGLDAVVLVGVSYTGPVAAQFAVERPDRVCGVVLASALPHDWTPDRRARFYLRAPRLLSPVFLVDGSMRVLPEIFSSTASVGDAARFTAAQTGRVLRAIHSPTRMATRLRWSEQYRFADPRRISQPVLVVTGEDGLDRVVAPADTRRYLAGLPSARHVVLPRTGHIGLLTRPHAFADVVWRFAAEVFDGARCSA